MLIFFDIIAILPSHISANSVYLDDWTALLACFLSRNDVLTFLVVFQKRKHQDKLFLKFIVYLHNLKYVAVILNVHFFTVDPK